MGLIGSLIEVLKTGVTGKRSWTPHEVRELIDVRRLDEARQACDQLTGTLEDLEAERACLLGEINFQDRLDDVAAAAFREALKTVPGMPAAHHGLSLIFAAQQKFDDAARHAQFALSGQPTEARFLAQYGYCHLCLGSYQMAENPLRRATLLMGGNAYLWNNLGIVLRVKGELDEARQCFERALTLDDGLESARSHVAQLKEEIAEGSLKTSTSTDNSHGLQANIGALDERTFESVLSLQRLGNLQAAIDNCEALLLANVDDERMPVVLAGLYERVGDMESAIDTLQAHLSMRPDSHLVAGALGLVAMRAQDYRSATPLLERALVADPEHLDYVVGLARSLSGQERFAEAGPLFERAVEMAPDDLGLLGQLTSNLANQCRYREAMEIIDDLSARGLFVGCKGSVLSFLGRFDEALVALNEDVARQPNDPALRFQRAYLNLLLENYSEGWDDYRFRGLSASKNFRMLPFPMWRGEPLKDKRVIVLTEQGLGDQIMFASCLPDLLAMNPKQVVVEMSHRVAETITRSFPSCEVVATKQNVNLDWVKAYADTDCFIPLADLPSHFRRSRDAFPQHSGYLHADPERIAYWRAALKASGPGPYIGVSWKGGTELTRASLRSLTPEQLLTLTSATKATWICLQYGAVQPEVDRLADTDMPLRYWPEAISDLDQFAALICGLDLVITVCNTTVHYAGGLGKPVWVLSPKVPEWRYGLSGETLPWYPSSRMFRQQQDGDWTGPLTTMCQELSLRFTPQISTTSRKTVRN